MILMNIKDFLPPVLVSFAKRAKGLENSKEYENFESAMKDCSSEAYENVELCNMIADKTVLYIASLKERPYSVNQTNVFLLAAINQYLIVNSTKEINILDFGGACGAHYFEVRSLIPRDISINWYVVETEQMVLSAMGRNLNNNELSFVSSIDDIKVKTDFLHSSSALQYVDAPYHFIDRLLKMNANWLFFNRMMFNENDRDFVTVQKSFLSSNGPGKLPKGYSDRMISYPHTTMSIQKFDKVILSQGYKGEWVFLESSGSHKIKNENICGRGMLYIKN